MTTFNRILFLVTLPDGSSQLLTISQIEETVIPPGATITLITPKQETATTEGEEFSLLVKNGQLILVIDDKDHVLKVELADPLSIQILPIEALPVDMASQLPSLLDSAGFDPQNYNIEPEVLVLDRSQLSMGNFEFHPLALGVLALGGGGGGGGGSSSAVQTIGATITQQVDDTGLVPVITLTITFDEDVTGFDINDISLTNATSANFAQGLTPSIYTVELTPINPAAPVSYSLAQGAGETSADSSVLTPAVSGSLDLTGPTVSSVASSSNDDTITITFNEDVSLQTLTGFTFTIGGVVTQTITNNIADVTISDNVATFQFANGTINQGDLIAIAYAPAVDDLEDTQGNDAAAINITSGVVADGYIKGAKVYLVSTDGERWDTGAVSDANGNYFLDTDAVATQIAAWPAGTKYSIVVEGGFNTDTGVANTQVLSAPSNAKVINPITTLIDKVAIANGGDAAAIAAAEATVKTALSLPPGFSLLSSDPIAAANSGDADALSVQKAAANVATVIAYAEQQTGNAGTSDTVLDAMVSKVQSGSLDLTNASDLADVTGLSDVTSINATVNTITNANSISDISTEQGRLLDTVAPSVGVVSLSSGSDSGIKDDGITNIDTVDLRVAIDVTSEDGTAVSLNNTVQLYKNDVALGQPITVNDGDLNKGYVTFENVAITSDDKWTVTITDVPGNASAVSAALQIELDQTAPTATLTMPSSSSDGFINKTEVESALVFTGTTSGAEAGQTLTLTLTDQSGKTVTKTGTVASNAFSIKVSSYDQKKLTDGDEITVSVTVTDVAGNVSTAATGTYTYDATNPIAPTNLALVTDSGSSDSDGISTSLAIQSITGIEQGASSEYRINGGEWAETYTEPSADGTYTIDVRQTDVAGNISDLTSLEDLILDTTDPVITSAATASVAEETAADTVIYTAKSTDKTAVTYSLKSGSDAKLTISSSSGEVTLTEIPDLSSQTEYNFTVIATDAAGNASEKAVVLSVTNVNEAPTVENIPDFVAVTEQAVSANVGNLSQYFSDADITEADDKLTFKLDGDLPAGLSFDTSTGVISGTATETKASSSFSITATDKSGLSTDPKEFTFIAVDAPAILSFAISDETSSEDYGKQGNNLTIDVTFSEAFVYTANNATPTLTLAFGSSTATAQFSAVDGANKTMSFTLQAPAGDATTTSITGITLGDASVVGVQSNQPMVTDSFGSPNTTYVLDNSVSTPTLSLADDTGTSDADYLTKDLTVNVALDSDISSWRYSIDGGNIFSDGSGSSFELSADTTYAKDDLVVEQTDLAGNVSELGKNTSAITTDTTTPEFTSAAAKTIDENTKDIVTLASTETNGPVTYTLSGTDEGLFEIVSDALKLKENADFEIKESYSVTATATDKAGNTKDQIITVTVTDLNESPSAKGSISDKTAVTGQVFTLDLSSYFEDQDNNGNDVLTYTTTNSLPPGLSLNSATGILSGTASAVAAATDITVTATDGNEDGAEDATQTFSLKSVDAPSVSSFTVVDSINTTSIGKAGDALTVTLTLTEAVSYTAGSTDSTASLTIGGVSVTATYSSSTDTTLVFTATAPSTVNSSDIVLTGVSLGDATLVSSTTGESFVFGNALTIDTYEVDNTAPAFTTNADDAIAVPKDVQLTDRVIYTATSNDANATFDLVTKDAGVSLNGAVVSYTGTATSEINFKLKVTDTAGNSSTQDIAVDAVVAPSLSTTLDGVDNFDPRNNIIFKVANATSWGDAGTYDIVIDNLANTTEKGGYQDETNSSDQTITVTIANDGSVSSTSGSSVTLSTDKTLLTITPKYDLDLDNNYSISIEEGLLKNDAGIGSVAVADVQFSTVTPGLTAATEYAAQFINTTGDLETGDVWLIGNQGNKSNSPVEVTVDVRDFETVTVFDLNDSYQTSDAYLKLDGFTTDDAIYLDDLGVHAVADANASGLAFNEATSSDDGKLAYDFSADSDPAIGAAQSRLTILNLSASDYFVLSEFQDAGYTLVVA